MTEKKLEPVEEAVEDIEEEPAPEIAVVSRRDELGFVVERVTADPVAASHWDERLWRRA